MSAYRKLSVVNRSTEAIVDSAIKVAFATTDMKHVDQHFGAAQSFSYYLVTPDGHSVSEVVQFPDEKMDGNEDKLVTKINALEGCAAVYVQAVGASAINKLLMIGVQPIKVSHGSPIKDLLNALSEELRDGPRTWLARAIAMQKDESRFEDMEEAGWNE